MKTDPHQYTRAKLWTFMRSAAKSRSSHQMVPVSSEMPWRLQSQAHLLETLNSNRGDGPKESLTLAYMGTELLSCLFAKPIARYYRRRPFTICAASSLPRQVSVGESLFAEASDPGGSRNGSTEMRS